MPLDQQVVASLGCLKAQDTPSLYELHPPTARTVPKRPVPITMHAQGGGWVVGLDTHADRNADISARTGSVVVSADGALLR